jgi:hypothetical protein
VTSATQALPDDPDLLKAMLLAERDRAERLEQIIKAMQRHRFGRKAESLPEDQLLLGLEEAEQNEAAFLDRSSCGAEGYEPHHNAIALRRRQFLSWR